MISKYFQPELFNIHIAADDKQFAISVSSLFTLSPRKSELNLNEEFFQKMVYTFWKENKTTYWKSLYLMFDGIDIYDHCNEYEIPCFYVKSGNKEGKIRYNYTHEIPKDWEISMKLVMKRTKKRTPVVDFIKQVSGGIITEKIEKEILEKLTSLISGKENYFNYHHPQEA